MILDLLKSQLGGAAAKTIGRQIGADSSTTQSAIAAALPMLLGALAKNSRDSSGARSLEKALDRDHSGSIFDNLSGFLNKPDTQAGDGILGHVLGGQRGPVESGLAAKTGISSGQVSQLLATLAPLVMGALGRAKSQSNIGSGGLFDLLRGETKKAGRAPEADLGMLSMLDKDGDGSILDDAAGFLGKFLGR